MSSSSPLLQCFVQKACSEYTTEIRLFHLHLNSLNIFLLVMHWNVQCNPLWGLDLRGSERRVMNRDDCQMSLLYTKRKDDRSFSKESSRVKKEALEVRDFLPCVRKGC